MVEIARSQSDTSTGVQNVMIRQDRFASWPGIETLSRVMTLRLTVIACQGRDLLSVFAADQYQAGVLVVVL